MLEELRLTLKLEVSHLSIFLGVSKQEIYKLIRSGQLLESDSGRQIRNLAQIANTFKNAGVKRADNLLIMKSFEGGKSLIDIVRGGGDWNGAVQILIQEHLEMENCYKASELSTSKAKPTVDWKSYLSTPHSPKDN